ncbi:hypothetical protein [Roseomonas populi]|uniref:Uncharacterized protein n=1 Tax=Roseomonas populi TaxID=3121582 RepID=A0ABT1X8N3_9PROT|nr:hypothetical protein [Roseomonas pecuniae]MCR0983748.1 hypothetical protein [Roseomonas pecuniae]
MSGSAEGPDVQERAQIAAAGLDATFAAHPAEVLTALRNVRSMRDRLQRPENPSLEPATVFRTPAETTP